MPYTTTTLGIAGQAVSARLADPTNLRWSVAEVQGYVQGALRVWNSLTDYYRDQVLVPTSNGVPFYDLSAVVPAACGSTITDRDLVLAIETALLEPQAYLSWLGSDQFTLDEIVSALQRRRDQFLLETGRILTRLTPTVIPTMGGRITLDQSILTLRRVACQNPSGVTPLHREDVWAFTHFAPGWVQRPGRPPQVPFGYATGETPPLVLQIVPPLTDRGTLDLLVVARGATLDPTIPVPLGIPDDWAWVVYYGALADLLSKDGLAADPDRAAYCDQRWAQGVTLAQAHGLVLAARINDVSVPVAAVAEADQYQPLWQSTPGPPQQVLLTSGQLVGCAPVPDGRYSLTLDVVVNTPVPVLSTDFLPLGPELLDVIYDYAEFAALFKEGMPTITSAQPLFDRFLRAAGVTVTQLAAQSPNRKPLLGQARQDTRQTAHTEVVAP